MTGVKDCTIKYYITIISIIIDIINNNISSSSISIIISYYYMAVSHKDWELPNSRIWLAEIDIDRSLDFPI